VHLCISTNCRQVLGNQKGLDFEFQAPAAGDCLFHSNCLLYSLLFLILHSTPIPVLPYVPWRTRSLKNPRRNNTGSFSFVIDMSVNLLTLSLCHTSVRLLCLLYNCEMKKGRFTLLTTMIEGMTESCSSATFWIN
jgi:hypothetical protein